MAPIGGWENGRPAAGQFEDGLVELLAGAATLFVALFFFDWAAFPVVGAFLGAALLLVVPFLRGALAAARAAIVQAGSASDFSWVARISRWRGTALVGLLGLLVALALVRLGSWGRSARGAEGASMFERWWPLLPMVVPPIVLFSSAWRFGLPRLAVAGSVGLVGATMGPLLGLAWRDSVALAAALLGAALAVTGGTTLRAYRRSPAARPMP